MRVGMIIGHQSGGVTQHENAILENLKLHASNCGHQFYVFSYDSPFDTEKLNCEHIKFIKVNKQPYHSGLINRIPSYVQRFLKLKNKSTDSLYSAINLYDIDLMYYLGLPHYSLI